VRWTAAHRRSGDAREQLNLNRRLSCQSPDQAGEAHRGREQMRVFGACPARDSRLLGGLPRTDGGSAANRNSLLTGKKTGKFSDFSRFLRKSVQKTLEIQ